MKNNIDMEINIDNPIRYKTDDRKFREFLADKTIPPGAKLIIFNLIYRAGTKNYAFPSQSRIAMDIGLSDRQVRYHLKTLKEKKIIWWKKGATNPANQNKLNSNSYYLDNILKIIEI